MSNEQVLTVVQETEILGKEIKLYRSVGAPLFEASDVASWLSITNVSQMLKQAEISENEKGIFLKYTLGGNQKSLFISEDAMYDVLMSSRKKEAKPMRRQIKAYLKQIRLTGGAVQTGREEDFVEAYFPSFTDDTKLTMIQDLLKQNKEYKEKIAALAEVEKDWKLLMDTTGTFCVNDIAHCIGIGEYKLFGILRSLGVLFMNNDGDNVPYENTVNKGKFTSCPAIAPNGVTHLQTRIYPAGISYITKLLRKHGYLEAA